MRVWAWKAALPGLAEVQQIPAFPRKRVRSAWA
jgi:hypothetical protein